MQSFYYSIPGIVLLLSFGISVNGLYCYRCLNIDCPKKELECQQTRTFIQAELKKFYYVGSSTDLDPCPELTQKHKWKLMQIGQQHNYDTCPAEKSNEATCSVGRMQIKTTKPNPEGEPTVQFNYATVMGCAKRQLLLRVNKPNVCDNFGQNQTSDGVVRELQIEHCSSTRTLCYEKDYCVNWTQSEIKKWESPEEAAKEAEASLSFKLGIFFVVIILLFALLLVGWMVQGRGSSDIPPTKKIIDDGSEAKVLQVKDENSSLRSIEIDMDRESKNEIKDPIFKRHSIPPVAATSSPKLETRGSTPV